MNADARVMEYFVAPMSAAESNDFANRIRSHIDEQDLQMPSQKVSMSLNGEQSQWEEFSKFCLPRTMAVARQYRKRVGAHLPILSLTFPFEDRVLVWLDAQWLSRVREFHRSSGPGLESLRTPKQLAEMDEEYKRRLKKNLGIVTRTKRDPFAYYFSADDRRR